MHAAAPRRYQATMLLHLCRAPESPLQMLGKFQDLPGSIIPRKKTFPENIYLVSYFHHMRFWECTVFHIFCVFSSKSVLSSYFPFYVTWWTIIEQSVMGAWTAASTAVACSEDVKTQFLELIFLISFASLWKIQIFLRIPCSRKAVKVFTNNLFQLN